MSRLALRLLVAAIVTVPITGGAAGPLAASNPSVSLASSVTLGSGGSPQDWWGRASIKRRADGVLVMLYRRGSVHFVNDGALHIKFSADNGATWTAEDTNLDASAVGGFPMNPSTLTAGQDAGEPWLYLAPNGDLVVHMWRIDYGVSMGGTWQARSTDGGQNWDASEQVAFGISGVDDDIIFATDQDFVLNGTTYTGARIYSGGADGTPSSMILIKNPTRDLAIGSWSKVSTIMSASEGSGSHGGQEVGLTYLGNNRIIAMLRDNDQTKSYRRFSDDLGLTWGTLTDMTSTMGIAGRQRVYTVSQLLGLPGWWKDPRLIMVGFDHMTPGSSADRRNTVWLSHDRGITWTAQFYLNTTTEDGGYGDLFWDFTNNRPVFVSYAGTYNAASLIQYNLTVTWV
jgi:hypothetical protein